MSRKQKPDYAKIWELEEELDLPHSMEHPGGSPQGVSMDRARQVYTASNDRDLEAELLHQNGIE